MAATREYSFKSRADMQVIKRQFNRNTIIMGTVGAVAVFGAALCDVLGKLFFSKRPISSFLSSSGNQWIAIITLVILFLVFAQTKFYAKVIRHVGRANLIVRQFDKGESDLEYGIQSNRLALVNKGIERLEGVEASFSEMPEYNELLAKGRAWLSEHQGK